MHSVYTKEPYKTLDCTKKGAINTYRSPLD